MENSHKCGTCFYYRPSNYTLDIGYCQERAPWPITRMEYITPFNGCPLLVLAPVTTYSNIVGESDLCEEYQPL